MGLCDWRNEPTPHTGWRICNPTEEPQHGQTPTTKTTTKPAAKPKGTGKFYIDRPSKAWMDILAKLPKVAGTQRVSDLAAAWGHDGWLVRNAAHELMPAGTLKVEADEAGRVCVVGAKQPAAKGQRQLAGQPWPAPRRPTGRRVWPLGPAKGDSIALAGLAAPGWALGACPAAAAPGGLGRLGVLCTPGARASAPPAAPPK